MKRLETLNDLLFACTIWEEQEVKHLVVCCDGTWNTQEQLDHGIPSPTNVCKIANSLAAEDKKGNAQLRYYHPGVGTEGSALARVAGGVRGKGLARNVQSAFGWIAENYEIGDRIWLFGFSRGAFTARSVAGMLQACGLPDLSGWVDADLWPLVIKAYEEVYRFPRGHRPSASTWAPNVSFHHDSDVVPIEFIGVWDTVGALGIPDDQALLNWIDDPRQYSFHDTELSPMVKTARHALVLTFF